MYIVATSLFRNVISCLSLDFSLLVQLARDLQSDFYPRFEQFFHVIVGLLDTYDHDTEVLDKGFMTLSYLIKFLWRPLLKDIQTVYK